MTEQPVGGRHVLDFDHHAPRFRDENKEVVAELHASGCPLAWTEHHDGYWAIYGYDAVFDAVQDWELFSSANSPTQHKGIPWSGYEDPLIPIDVDGDLVKEYRRVVLNYLSPGGAKAEEPHLRAMCNELIDGFIEKGSCDLSQELLTPLPARWILEALGWAPERWSEWIVWIHTTIHDRTEHPEKAQEALGNIFANIGAEMEKRRANPGNDLFSQIMQATPGGRPMTDTQIVMYAYLALLGGMDTTAGLTGNVIELLDQRPDLRQRLLDDPSLIPKATEEFLRYESPSYGLYRTVTRDAEFHGQQLHKGERVMLMFPAANQDPAFFADPHHVDFARTNNRHMAFGLGPHRCLGSHHARVMFQIMLGEILRRLPDFRISAPVTRFHDSGDVYAIRNLPITFTPGRRES